MQTDQSHQSRSRRRGASLLLGVSGIGFIVLLELALRLVGVGPSNDLFLKEESGPSTRYVANRAVAHRFFQPQFRRDFAGGIQFADPKPAGTVRIFVLGASTVIGWPNPPNTAFPRYLEQMLTDVFPSREFEIINCGLTAINSFCLLDFAEEIVDYSPDLIILYTGHNEFVGPYGVTTPFLAVGNNWHGIRLFMHVQRSRIYHILKELRFGVRSWTTGSPQREAFGLHLVNEEIGPSDEGYATTEHNFRRNLEEILIIAGESHIPVMLSTLTSNVRDFYPLRSQCDGSAPTARIKTLAADGHVSETVTLAEEALQATPDCADIHFLLGQASYQLEQYDRAASAFVAARDLDRMPFRAPSSFNAVIRELAEESGGRVLLNDVEETFAAASPHGLVGNELMTEYLHPTVYGHYLIARSIVDLLTASAPAEQWGLWYPERISSYSEYNLRLGHTLVETFLARNYLIRFWETLPYREPPATLRQSLVDLVQEQVAQIRRLDPITRRTLAERGELELLRQMRGFLPREDRRALDMALRE